MGIVRPAVTAFSIRSRRRKAARISAWLASTGARTSLLVGCRPSKLRNVNIVENAVADHTNVVAAVDLPAASDADFPWPYVQADGRDLPWHDQAVDVILANAVIEHVGGLEDQRRFVAEQCRVARSWVITTPNRWFPVESHTATVLRHWSRRWRNGRREFTRLLSLGEFRTLLPAGTQVIGHWWSPTFTAFWEALPSDPQRHESGAVAAPQGVR